MLREHRPGPQGQCDGSVRWADIASCLSRVTQVMSEARVLVTSRTELTWAAAAPDSGGKTAAAAHSTQQPTGMQHSVAALTADASCRLVRSLAPASALGEHEVAAVVAAVGGVPLLLRLVTDALVCGRVGLSAVRTALATAGSTEAEASEHQGRTRTVQQQSWHVTTQQRTLSCCS